MQPRSSVSDRPSARNRTARFKIVGGWIEDGPTDSVSLATGRRHFRSGAEGIRTSDLRRAKAVLWVHSCYRGSKTPANSQIRGSCIQANFPVLPCIGVLLVYQHCSRTSLCGVLGPFESPSPTTLGPYLISPTSFCLLRAATTQWRDFLPLSSSHGLTVHPTLRLLVRLPIETADL